MDSEAPASTLNSLASTPDPTVHKNAWSLFLELFDRHVTSKGLLDKAELERPIAEFKGILQNASDQQGVDQDPGIFMQEFVDHLHNHVVLHKSPWTYWILFIIAESTRELPQWRDMLGEKQRAFIDEPVPQQPSSVLEVVRRFICEDLNLNSECNHNLKEALRIVGNCCADNNINRSLLIYRGGINHLWKVINNGGDVGTVIAVLYNICSDYDEPALDDSGHIYRQPDTSEEDIASGAYIPITVAEKYLAQWQNQHLQYTTIETLLMHSEQCDEMYFPYLCDLLRMCVGVANVDLSAILNPSEEVPVTDQIDNLIECLFSFGERMVERSPEVVNDLCDIVRLLLQNAEIEKQLLKKDIKYLTQFLLRWPYEVQFEDEEDLQRQRDSQLASLQLLYQLVDKPDYVDMISSSPRAIHDFTTTLQDYINNALLNLPNTTTATTTRTYSISYIASILVLLCNAAKSPFIATKMSTSTLPTALTTLLPRTTQTILLTPALRLATRLAQTEGTAHQALYDADIFSAIHYLLTHPRGIPPAIWDEAVHLLRLYLVDTDKATHADELVRKGLLADLLRIAASNAPYLDSSGLRRQIAAVVLELAKIVEEEGRRRAGVVAEEVVVGSQGHAVPSDVLVDVGVALVVGGDGNVLAVVLASWVLLALKHSGGKREVLRGLKEETMGAVLRQVVEKGGEATAHDGVKRNLQALWQLVENEQRELPVELVELMQKL